MSHSEQGKNDASDQLVQTITPWHSLDTETALRHLEVDPATGLNREDVDKRLEVEGYNELTVDEGISPLALLLGQFRNILIIVLLAAAGLSALVGEMVDAVIILIIVLFSALLGFFQEYRAERAVEALKRMLSPTVSVLRDGDKLEVASNKGDATIAVPLTRRFRILLDE
jgi:Ca2+-transporting ATPase